MEYDLVVIGGGPAGYLAAERAGHGGFKTLVIEKRHLGGVCLNEGCIPSKTLLHSAKIYDYARFSSQYGVTAESVHFDHGAVIQRKNKVIRMLTAGVRTQLKKSHTEVLEGSAQILGKTSAGFEIAAGGQKVMCKRLLIAAGSMPIVPPLPGVQEGLAEGFVLTNREILDLPKVPASLVIIGGGAIGLEMASYFNSAGSQVTVIEMLDHIAGNTDREIGSILQKNYEKKGVVFYLSVKATKAGQGQVWFLSEGQTLEIPAEKVLLSIGRCPVTEGYGLENIGVFVERGRIAVDANLRTNVPGVYAAGDVTGKSLLAHTAYRQAEVAVNHMLGRRDTMRYEAIPSVIYTNPEVAAVGETEESARKKGLSFEAVTLPMGFSGRYLAENEGGDGICKVLVDKKHRTLLGVHVIGSYASEFIVSAAIMMEMEMRVEDIKEIVFPHPTASEILREGIFALPL